MAISNVYADNGDLSVAKKPGVSTVHIDNMPQGGSGGVTSVNGQTGDVTLTASDVGALPSSTSIPTKTSDLNNDSGFITAAQVPVEVETNVGSFELAGDNPIEVRYTAQTSTTVEGANVPATANTRSDYGMYKALVSFDLNDFHKAVDAGFNPKLKINQDITGLDASATTIQVAFDSSATSLVGGYFRDFNASSYTAQTLDINTILSSTAGTNTKRYLIVGIWKATENTEEGAQALAEQMLSKITLEDWPRDVSSSYTTIPEVDQTYNASSTNAQSGVAVAGAISAATPTLSDLNTAGITDIQQVAALPASPVSTVLYLIPES